MMRELKKSAGRLQYTKITVLDDPGQGWACHKYHIGPLKDPHGRRVDDFGFIHFQNGPVKEFGVNGCHQEDLLAIVVDRLRSFQAGAFACRENAIALTKVEEAIHWLNHRTNERIDRGVEGTNTL